SVRWTLDVPEAACPRRLRAEIAVPRAPRIERDAFAANGREIDLGTIVVPGLAALRGVVTGPGAPASGAHVWVECDSGQEISACCDEHGRYALAGLPAGAASLRVGHPQLRPRLAAGVPLRADAVLDFDVALEPLAPGECIEGIVRTPDGRGLAGACVSVISRDR